MTAATLLLTATVLVAACLAVLLARVGRSLLRARRQITSAKTSRDHPASVRLFVDAQTKLMKLDAMMAGVLTVGLVVMLALARQAIVLLGTA